MNAVQPINSRLSQRKLLLAAFVEWLKEQRLIDLGLDLETQAAEMMDFVGITPVMQMVIGERALQEAKGFDAAHDDGHVKGEMAEASMSYAWVALGQVRGSRGVGLYIPGCWPFESESFKPRSTPAGNCILAASFLIAEAERLERAAEWEKSGAAQCVPTSGKEGLGDA